MSHNFTKTTNDDMVVKVVIKCSVCEKRTDLFMSDAKSKISDTIKRNCHNCGRQTDHTIVYK